MNNKHKTLAVLALTACFTLPASAQLGGLLGGMGSKPASASSGDVDTEVKGFLERSMRVESTVNKAATAIIAAYASEEDRAKLQEQLNSINKLTDPKEAGAKFKALNESNNAVLEKLANAKDLGERTNQLSEAKKVLLAKGVSNFLLGALQAKDLAPSGQNVLKSAGANPMNLTKVAPVQEALPRLANAASVAGSSIPNFVKALQGANVKVNAVTTSTKEEQLTDI